MVATPTIVTSTPVAATALFGGQPADLIALADIKLELNITDGSNDAWLEKVITRASRAISSHCSRVFQPQTYQEDFWAEREAYPFQLPPGFFPLQLSNWPIAWAPSPAGTAPPLAPSLSAVAGGALNLQRVYARISYVTPLGETAASQEENLFVAANNLLSITAPLADSAGIATGWNVYVGTKSFGEVLQNATPIAMGVNWTMPTSGLITSGTAVPNYILAVENFAPPLQPTAAQPLAEGIDFISDYDQGNPSKSKGWLTRLFFADGSPATWRLPVQVVYGAGFNPIPDDLQDVCLDLVKSMWFGRQRDPMLRQENIEGIYSATWWFGSGPGGESGLPREVVLKLQELGYRVPTIA